MSRLIHISDVHFGRDRPELVAPFLTAVNESGADLVVLSGDLTQRARRDQFARAAAMIAGLRAPVLTIPGNHDVPLYNIFQRLTRPYAGYRRHIGKALEPSSALPDCIVQGINTVEPLYWQQGRLRPRGLKRLSRTFADKGGRLGIAALHHPLQSTPGNPKLAMSKSETLLRRMADQGTDIVLSGHVHAAHIGPFLAEPRILFVQAGTALSDRLRTGQNSYNVIDIAGGKVSIRVMAAGIGGSATPFTPGNPRVFVPGSTGWQEEPQV